MFSHVGFMANSAHAYGYLLFLLLAVEGSDVAAFTAGKLFGRRKLREAISPNKTWGGALGALAFSMTLPWLLRFSFPHFGWKQLVLAGLIVGVGGQLGDLALSMIKRDVGVKDMGSLIPGHGGLLDRLDSLIFTAPLFFHMVRWFYDIY
jgi:phosphatidate cytidylyltransferase